MTVEVKTTMKFKPWRAPNFALLEVAANKEGHAIPVAELDGDALEALARSWLEDLYSGTQEPNPFRSMRDAP